MLRGIYFILVLTCLGCGEMETTDDVAARDKPSAHVLDLTAQALQGAKTWSVPGEPLVSIGESNAAHEFSRIAGGKLLSDGSIVVADGMSRELRVFLPSGQHQLTCGGLGDGPGEFRSVEWIQVGGGDSLYGWDSQLERLTIFDRFGQFAATKRIELPGRPLPIFVSEMLPDFSLMV